MFTFFSEIIALCGKLIFFPVKNLSAEWQMLYAVILSTLIALFVFRLFALSGKVSKVKDLIKGAILQMRIYRDNARIMFLSLLKALFFTLKYFALNLLPVIIIFPLLLPLFVQMDANFSYQPLKSGENFIFQLKLRGSLKNYQLELLAADFYQPVMKPVNVYSRNEINWKLKALKSGMHDLQFCINKQIYSKKVVIAARAAISPVRFQPDSYNRTVYPLNLSNGAGTFLTNFFSRLEPLFFAAERAFPAEAEVIEAKIFYQPAEFKFLFLHWHWIIIYLLLVIILALLLKKWFRVDF